MTCNIYVILSAISGAGSSGKADRSARKSIYRFGINIVQKGATFRKERRKRKRAPRIPDGSGYGGTQREERMIPFLGTSDFHAINSVQPAPVGCIHFKLGSAWKLLYSCSEVSPYSLQAIHKAPRFTYIIKSLKDVYNMERSHCFMYYPL